MQIHALRSQTVKPKEIWLWVNDDPENRGFDFDSLKVDRIFKNNHNWKFYGRFAAALLVNTEFVAIYDDDTVPGKKWHENCLQTIKTHNGILGSAGIKLKSKIYTDHDRVGWPSKNRKTEEVDLPWGGKLYFYWCIVGGSIDARFINAIKKGIMNKMEEGPLTGSNSQDIRVCIYDGKMHSLDSNEISFRLAGAHAFQEAFENASPTQNLKRAYCCVCKVF